MEREQKNPYVTQIELDRQLGKTERELESKINTVDKKHDANYSKLDKSIDVMTSTFGMVAETMKENTQEVKGMRQDNMENNKELRESLGKIDKAVMEHDLQLGYHTEKFINYDKALDGKRMSSGKWITVISGALVAFISGMFGLSYIVAEYILPIIFSK